MSIRRVGQTAASQAKFDTQKNMDCSGRQRRSSSSWSFEQTSEERASTRWAGLRVEDANEDKCGGEPISAVQAG